MRASTLSIRHSCAHGLAWLPVLGFPSLEGEGVLRQGEKFTGMLSRQPGPHQARQFPSLPFCHLLDTVSLNSICERCDSLVCRWFAGVRCSLGRRRITGFSGVGCLVFQWTWDTTRRLNSNTATTNAKTNSPALRLPAIIRRLQRLRSYDVAVRQ